MSAPGSGPTTDRERVIAFWDKFRAGMQAVKVERDCTKAVGLLEEALEFDPRHEDTRYYLANCLAAEGKVEAALDQYEQLTHINPQSHRGFARWGTLRAMTARSSADLADAERALDNAYRLNPEETGALLSLGEVSLLRAQPALAQERFSAICRTNPRATGGFFLLGYLRWKAGDVAGAADLLDRARATLGPDWKPQGATAEGDVARTAHAESTPLSRFWEQWDGSRIPQHAYAQLDARLKVVLH